MTEVKRGRPRPQETILRDETVLATLRHGAVLTRNEIADVINEDPQLVYLALHRLRDAGLVDRANVAGKRNHWRQVNSGE